MNSEARQVTIGCASDLDAFGSGEAIVVVDVIRATTTLATALVGGRRCFPVASVEDARALAARLDAPLLAGEVAGVMPGGFDLNNSPAELAVRDDSHRPLILLTTSGTRVLASARASQTVSAASLRNWTAEVDRLARSDWQRVALVGAETRGEFRREDQLCCAWIGAGLVERGFHCADAETDGTIERWAGADVNVVADGHSADYLRRSGQLADLEFIVEHVDDLDLTFALDGEELVAGRVEVAGGLS